jgi:hypothetical protein
MPTKRASRAARRRAEAKGRPPILATLPVLNGIDSVSWPDVGARMVPRPVDLAMLALDRPSMGFAIRPECIVANDPRAEAVLRHTLSDARVNAEAYRAIVLGEVTAELEEAVRAFVTRTDDAHH